MYASTETVQKQDSHIMFPIRHTVYKIIVHIPSWSLR